MFLLFSRASMMTLIVTALSWTIQAVWSPVNLQPTGENMTPQPTQTPTNLASECLFHSFNTLSNDQGHRIKAGNEDSQPYTQNKSSESDECCFQKTEILGRTEKSQSFLR